MRRNLAFIILRALGIVHSPFYNPKFTGLKQNPDTGYRGKGGNKCPQHSRKKHRNDTNRKIKRRNKQNKRR